MVILSTERRLRNTAGGFSEDSELSTKRHERLACRERERDKEMKRKKAGRATGRGRERERNGIVGGKRRMKKKERDGRGKRWKERRGETGVGVIKWKREWEEERNKRKGKKEGRRESKGGGGGMERRE